jgi:hypothetical protein
MSEPTMMETAETNTTAAPASDAAANNSATAEKLYGGEQKATATQDQQAADAAAAGKAPATDAEATEAPAEDKPTAPETYEFKAPEGRVFDSEVIAEYSKVAKELNLSQEAAQRVLDAMAPKMAERQQAQIEAVRKEWVTNSKSDKEFGGDKLSENLGVAKKALDAFGTAELRSLLNQSGLGDHPEVIRFMYRAGKAISEDRFVGGAPAVGKGAPKGFSDFADVLYSST